MTKSIRKILVMYFYSSPFRLVIKIDFFYEDLHQEYGLHTLSNDS
jgi:glycogen debranching enzyme